MTIHKGLAISLLILCCVFYAATPLHSADDTKLPAGDDPPPPKAVMRVYDIRPLLMPPDDFPFATSPHAAAFVVPPNLQGIDFSNSYGGGEHASLLFGGRQEKPLPTREELAAELVKTVTDSIQPDTWRDAGGALGSIRELNGILIVRQSEAAQKEIASFLQQLSELRNQPIRTTADWLVLTPAEMGKLVKPSANGNAGTPREVDAAALAALSSSVRHFHVELPGHNGQTLHSLSGHEKSVTISQSPVVGTAVSAYSPIIGIVADGVAIQVTPVADYERKSAVVTVFSTFNEGQQQGPEMTLHSYATTQPTPGEPNVALGVSASYHEVSSTVQEFRSTLRMPLNTPVLAGSMTLAPSARESDARQLLLILCVHAGN